MKCPECGFEGGAGAQKPCPKCGLDARLAHTASTRVSSRVVVGAVKSGKVTGVAIKGAKGPVSVHSVVTTIQKKIFNGEYVGRKTIVNNILVLGPEVFDEFTRTLVAGLGVDERVLVHRPAEPVPPHVSRQIREITAAQRTTARKGIKVTPATAYRLGMLAAYSRNYEEALGYFRQATALNPEFSQAYRAISWLQQSLAVSDLDTGDRDAATVRLREALDAGVRTDPLDHEALNQRGYVAKTLAQLAEAKGDEGDRERYYKEAARLFGHVAELKPDDPGAQNGLGNVQHALGDLDAAVAAYRRAIELAPAYAAAHHDLALAYEDKMALDAPNAAKWRRRAISEWRQAHLHGQQDPGFTPEDLSRIASRIQCLEPQGC